MFGVGEGAILPIVPLTARDLGASVAAAALVVTLIGVGSLVSNVPASIVTRRFGERRAMVGASLWAALAMLLCMFARELAVFSLAILMIGMSAAVFNLARLSWLAEAVPVPYRARALSTLGGVLRIGLFLGPFVAAAAIHAFGALAAYGVGIVVLVAGALVARSVGELPTPGGAAASRRVPLRLAEVLREHRRVFATVGLGVVLIAAVRASRQGIVPLWADHIGLGAASVSLIYGLSNAVDMLVFYPAGRRMDLRGRRAVAVPSMMIMGIALLAMPFTHSAPALLAAALLIGFGNGIGSGLVMTLGVDHAPVHARTQFLGVWRLLSDVGATAGPALLSAVAAVAPLAAAVASIGGVAFAGAAAFSRWAPRSVPPAAPSTSVDS
ncbi:MAG: MFS transporter [Burkholderiaceae bacterium]|nr:MFS transporter [Burkholderiaceae bacterium]